MWNILRLLDWRSKGAGLCFGVRFFSSGTQQETKPGEGPAVPIDKDLIEQMLNSPGDEPKYLLGEGT